MKKKTGPAAGSAAVQGFLRPEVIMIDFKRLSHGKRGAEVADATCIGPEFVETCALN